MHALPKHGRAYVSEGQEACETAYRERAVLALKRRATASNLDVLEKVEAGEPAT